MRRKPVRRAAARLRRRGVRALRPIGIGAIADGLWLAQRSDQRGLPRIVLATSVLTALTVLAFALCRWFWPAVACVTVAGFAMVVAGAGTQTVLQSAVDETMRGRVLSLFGLIFRGGPAPAGARLGSMIAWPNWLGVGTFGSRAARRTRFSGG